MARPMANGGSKKYSQCILSINDLENPEKYVGKLKNDIEIRSSWELAFCKYLDKSPNVLEWKSEESIVMYKHPRDKRMHRYFIDFWAKIRVIKSNKIKELWIEIKPWNQSQDKPILTEKMSAKTKKSVIETWAVNQAKWEYAKREGAKRKINFIVITEKNLMFNG